MKMLRKNLWSFAEADAICITTNCFVKQNGSAVMGRGCAYEATKKFVGIERRLGMNIAEYGLNTSVLYEKTEVASYAIIAFPVKPRSAIYTGNNKVEHFKCELGNIIPGWACKASTEMIENNLKRLPLLCNENNFTTQIVLPLPGCGAGELNKEDIIPLLEKYLDDRFVVVYK